MWFSPLGSIYWTRKWWVELIVSLILAHIDGDVQRVFTILTQLNTKIGQAQLLECWNNTEIIAPPPVRSHTWTRFQYGLIEIVRVQLFKHKILTRCNLALNTRLSLFRPSCISGGIALCSGLGVTAHKKPSLNYTRVYSEIYPGIIWNIPCVIVWELPDYTPGYII